VDIILWYKTYIEQILLIVLSLSKQDLILEFMWLKSHNPKFYWKEGEVLIIHCYTCYSEYQDIWKIDKLTHNFIEFYRKAGDYLYITIILSDSKVLNLHAATTTSQCFSS